MLFDVVVVRYRSSLCVVVVWCLVSVLLHVVVWRRCNCLLVVGCCVLFLVAVLFAVGVVVCGCA